MISAQPMNGSFLKFKLKHTWSLQLVGQSSTCRAPYQTTSPSFIFHLDISFRGTCHGHTDKDSMSSSDYQDFSLVDFVLHMDNLPLIGRHILEHWPHFLCTQCTVCHTHWHKHVAFNKVNFWSAGQISTFSTKLLRICLLTCLLVYLLTCLFAYLLTCLFVYLFKL